MSQHTKLRSLQKYQVYFFLYIAVICELLIVIVERDDAEAALSKEVREISTERDAILKEYLKNSPSIIPINDNRMKVGETRKFTIHLRIGEATRPVQPPRVQVMQITAIGDTLVYDTLTTIPSAPYKPIQTDYRLQWTAREAGNFVFKIEGEVDRVGKKGDWVRIGNSNFKTASVNEIIRHDSALIADLKSKGKYYPDDPSRGFIETGNQLDPSQFTVEVFREEVGDQLTANVSDIITAEGFTCATPIRIAGTTPEKIQSVVPSIGRVENLNWSHRFSRAGEYIVTTRVTDSRGLGDRSRDEATFRVIVKQPTLLKKIPSAYLGENFNFNFAVEGLGDGKYSYVYAGRTISGSELHIDKVTSDIDVQTLYDGKPYEYIDPITGKAIPSTFHFEAKQPPIHIEPGFSLNDVYPVNNIFEFNIDQCGRCSGGNIKPVVASTIRVETYIDGRISRNSIQVLEGTMPGTSSVVKMRFDTRVRRETSATIVVHAGSKVETFEIKLR